MEGGGGEETYENPGFIAACSTAQTNRPEVNVRSNPLFDRATTGHPLCGPAAFESSDKSFNPFPPQRGGGWLLCFLARRWPGILALCPSLCFPPLGKNTGTVLFSDGF